MSKKIPAQIKCPSCGSNFDTELYRSIWIEDSKNLQLIFDDLINTVKCPQCEVTTKLDFPFLCTNVKRKFALWYEPYHDPEIDKDIAQYANHMGKDSFYAKAPRIRDWNEFKNKISEFEMSKNSTESIDLSAEMKSSLSGFVKKIKSDNKESKYPKYIRHLRTAKGRLLYSPLPFLLLCLFIIVDDGLDGFLRILERDTDGFIGAALVFSFGSFVALSLLNIAVLKIIPNWKTRKDIRLWCFGSIYWLIGVFLFVAIFDPYNNGSWGYMNDDEWLHMFLVMLVPPIFIGSAKYVYEKHIK